MTYTKYSHYANDFAPTPLFKIFYRADKYFAKADSNNIFLQKTIGEPPGRANNHWIYA